MLVYVTIAYGNDSSQRQNTMSIITPPRTRDLTPAARTLHPVAVYLAELTSPESRRTMRGALGRIAAIASDGKLDADAFPWHQLRVEHVSAIRARLAEQYRPATASKMLSALRGVLRACWRLELIEEAAYRRAIDIKPVKGHTLPAGRSLSSGEMRQLFDACARDESPAGIRDAAIMAVLYGCRRAEVAAMDLADYDAETGELRIMAGKGRKERTFYLTNGAKDAVDDWIDARGPEPGALFVPVRKGGAVLVRPLTSQAIYDALAKRTRQAGLKALSPHDLRRTFAGDLLDLGVDISTVQRLMGHANVATTQRYDRRPEAVKKAAAAKVFVPYSSRAGA